MDFIRYYYFFGATGIHFFTKLVKCSLEPIYAFVVASASAFVISIMLLPFTSQSVAQIKASWPEYKRDVLMYCLNSE